MNPDHSDTANLREFTQAAVQSGKVGLSDLYREPRSGRVLMAVTIPVADVGAFVLDIDAARFLAPYVEIWPTASPTAETDLVRLEGNDIVNLTELRHKRGAVLTYRRPRTNPNVPEEVLLRGWLRHTKD